jgi:hypothetical protein
MLSLALRPILTIARILSSQKNKRRAKCHFRATTLAKIPFCIPENSNILTQFTPPNSLFQMPLAPSATRPLPPPRVIIQIQSLLAVVAYNATCQGPDASIAQLKATTLSHFSVAVTLFLRGEEPFMDHPSLQELRDIYTFTAEALMTKGKEAMNPETIGAPSRTRSASSAGLRDCTGTWNAWTPTMCPSPANKPRTCF